ncbi:MAG: Phosphoribosyl-ATP pyrophosphatase [Alphaproteobacteria bacterium MarineAlpha4_Bin2]|nr:MAG: Phosphoribosyl-ATP pyrophosphatase [Alphaproteobacteria bacterium MarineAlpha4_Bin2]
MTEKPEINAKILDRLFAVVESRRGSDAESSYTAKLLAAGTPKIAQKVGEEAVETVIEALAAENGKLAEESADLLYHLLVLWADKGVRPEDVWSILQGRLGISGIHEKNSRGKD